LDVSIVDTIFDPLAVDLSNCTFTDVDENCKNINQLDFIPEVNFESFLENI
jgi:hypothetical protein